MTWFDLVLAVVIFVCVMSGLGKGFSRTAIGFVTFVVAIGCALWFYVPAGFWFRSFIHSRTGANEAGFFAVFLLVMLVGEFVERAAVRFVAATELTWLDRLLGAAGGGVQGVVTAALVVLAVLTFVPKPLPPGVTDSRIRPYLTGTAHVVSALAPDEVRAGFLSACKDLEKVLPAPMKHGLERLTATAR